MSYISPGAPAKEVPIGMIAHLPVSITGVPALLSSWVGCFGQVLSDASSPLNGQTIPNLNGAGGGTQYFLRGVCGVTGGFGGADSHSHTLNSLGLTSGAAGGDGWLLASCASNSTDVASSLPSFYEARCIMKIK